MSITLYTYNSDITTNTSTAYFVLNDGQGSGGYTVSAQSPSNTSGYRQTNSTENNPVTIDNRNYNYLVEWRKESNIQLKVNILKENAEAGMVHPEAVEGWIWFLEFLQVAQSRQVKPKTKYHAAPDAQLLKAAYDGNLDALKTALQAGANFDVSDGQGISALRWAAQSGRAEVVKPLLDAGANINQQSESGWTALMQAVIAGSVETVSLLIERGADVNARSFADASALYCVYDVVPLSPDQGSARQNVKLLKACGAEYSVPSDD